MKKMLRFKLFSIAVIGASVAAFGSYSAKAQTNYEYDALGRLISVERVAASKTVTYTYDELGNRVSVIQGVAPTVTFTIDDVAVTEGGNLQFTITKSGATGQTHDVDYDTANGTAVSSDYTAASGTLSFTLLETSKNVIVATTTDATYENNETVLLNLSNATNGAVITDSQGVGTINNDDTAPSFTINNVTKEEGLNLQFTVTKTGSTALTHNINYATANGTATAGSDYVARSGTMSFPPATSSKILGITGIEDSTVEPNETFYSNLSNATNGATISDSQGLGTITNDDNAPPNAVNDSYSNVNKTTWTTFSVLNNDTDPENDPLTITQAAELHGTTQIISNNTQLRYRCIGCGASDTITYWISDGNGGTDTGIVSVTFSGGGGWDP